MRGVDDGVADRPEAKLLTLRRSPLILSAPTLLTLLFLVNTEGGADTTVANAPDEESSCPSVLLPAVDVICCVSSCIGISAIC